MPDRLAAFTVALADYGSDEISRWTAGEATLAALWPRLRLRPDAKASSLIVETSPGVAFCRFWLVPYRRRQRDPDLVRRALIALVALDTANA